MNLESECSGVLWLELSRTERILEKKLKHPSDLVKSPLLLPTISSAGTGRFEYRKPGTVQGLMLKLELQYFGHLMRRVDSLEKTLMLGVIGGRKSRAIEDEMPGWYH